MKRAIFFSTLADFARSPLRVGALGVVTSIALLLPALAASGQLPQPELQYVHAFVLGTGIIGGELSTGRLQLLATRPLRRATWVFARWSALVTACLALTVLQHGIALLVIALSPAVVAPAPAAVALSLGASVATALGYGSLIVGLSALARGHQDLALFAILALGVGLLHELCVSRGWAAGRAVATAVRDHLVPRMRLEPLVTPEPLDWEQLACWASTIAVSLTIAIHVTNRRELSSAKAD